MFTGKYSANIWHNVARFVALVGLMLVTTWANGQEALQVSSGVPNAGLAPRTWTDATGQYTIRGTLFQAGSYAVRILKDDGLTSAVPIEAFGADEQEYLVRHAADVPHNPRLDTVEGWASLLPHVAVPPTSVDESRVLAKLRVSGELMDRLFTSSFVRHRPVRETIVGKPVSGSSQTVGRANVALSPDANQAVFLVPITGVVTSQTTSYAGPVQVHGRGYSPFRSSVRVELDHRGVRVVPGLASASTQSTVTGISTSYGPLLDKVVRRAAQRRVAAAHGQAESEAARIVERQINETVTSETDQSMGRLRQMAGMKITDLRSTAERFGVRGRFSTTHEHLNISLVAREGVQLAKSAPPRLPASSDSMLVAQLHLSLVEKAMSEAEQLDTIAPVIERLLARNLEPIVKAQEFFKSGSVDMQWSDDEQWLTISWIAN